jgi:hypothetical protein
MVNAPAMSLIALSEKIEGVSRGALRRALADSGFMTVFLMMRVG